MKTRDKSFEDLYDVLAIRVIIDSNEDKNYCELGSDPDLQKCYEVIGVVHALFRPIPGRFKDYIAMPKYNSYQSLHTAVIGPEGKPVEIQIRTRRMHHIAEYGIAAHWRYKEAGGSVVADGNVDRKLGWLRQLVDWQQDLVDAQEYLDTVKMDLFADEVFVFSPRGDVFDLPSGATPVDFAYRVHTDIGHHCVGARINERIVPLSASMKNGDIVEIITNKNGRPTMDWLNFAKTHAAKNRIRQWFKRHHKEEHIQQGRQMLEAELGKPALEEFLKSDKCKEMIRRLNVSEANDVLAAVGYGDLSTSQIVNKVREQQHHEQQAKKALSSTGSSQPAEQSNVGTLGGLMHHLAKCCQPVPGEEIIGVVTRGSGISVHRTDCNNLLKVEVNRKMPIDWSKERADAYPAALIVETIDRVGIAGDILKKVSDHKINLRDARVETNKDQKIAVVSLILDVVDIAQLNKVAQSIKQISDVIRITRRDHRKKAGNGTAKASNVTPLKPKKTSTNDQDSEHSKKSS